jgi:hypothetical protein
VNGLVTILPISCEAGTKFAMVLNQRLNDRIELTSQNSASEETNLFDRK